MRCEKGPPPPLLALKVGEDPQAKRHRRILEAGKGRKTDSLLARPERNAGLPTLILAYETVLTTDPQNWKRINLCCFKTLSLWQFVQQPQETNITGVPKIETPINGTEDVLRT